MTKEDIIRMAREAGLVRAGDNWTEPARWGVTEIERFATLVAAAERSECAKAVEDYCGAWDDEGYALAAAIRARGQQ